MPAHAVLCCTSLIWHRGWTSQGVASKGFHTWHSSQTDVPPQHLLMSRLCRIVDTVALEFGSAVIPASRYRSTKPIERAATSFFDTLMASRGRSDAAAAASRARNRVRVPAATAGTQRATADTTTNHTASAAAPSKAAASGAQSIKKKRKRAPAAGATKHTEYREARQVCAVRDCVCEAECVENRC